LPPGFLWDWDSRGDRRAEEPLDDPLSALPELAAQCRRVWALRERWLGELQEAKLRALAEFAAGAAHELNNPLAIISGRAQLLLREERVPDRRRDLATIIAQAQRAHEMLADLRLFARPPEPVVKTVDIAELLSKLLAALQSEFAARVVEIRTVGLNTPVFCRVDPLQLEVAVAAVLRNALEAIGQNGWVEVRLEAGPSQVEIEVQDSGPGISPEHLEHIFDPFFSGRQAGRGLGFGLSKAWRIIQMHGGKILVHSLPGGGTLLCIQLPRGLPAD
jgi:signal transduction histidine kinase